MFLNENKIVRLLLVDDDKEDIQLTMEILHKYEKRITVSVSNNGQEAMDYLEDLLKNHHLGLPDLIFLDLNMPLKNGYELLVELKSHDKLSKIPVVIFSSSKSQHDIDSNYAAGASCFISKPVGLSELERTMHVIVDYWTSIVKYPSK